MSPDFASESPIFERYKTSRAHLRLPPRRHFSNMGAIAHLHLRAFLMILRQFGTVLFFTSFRGEGRIEEEF